MIHLVVGLFNNTKQAGFAIAELKETKLTKDISLIAKDPKTGKVHLYQVKQNKNVEDEDMRVGAEIGALAGILGGLSIVVNPALAIPDIVLAVAALMGVFGATTGAAVGSFIGDDLDERRFPPKRAQMYSKKIHKGEVFVSVSAPEKDLTEIEAVFHKHGADPVHRIESK